MTLSLTALAEHVAESRPVTAIISFGELILATDADKIVPLIEFLRDDEQCQFTQLMDICGVDYPARPRRFEIVYNLLSVRLNQRVRVKLQTDEATPVATVTGLYSTAGWFEREIWDLYGVAFSGHPDLRRILTDYGFDGHPQRKDFPLTGYVELRYDPERRRVAYSPVVLPQAYRTFDFLSPWDGPAYALPGDEKAQANAAKAEAK